MSEEEARYRRVFRAAHAHHAACAADEWLHEPCRMPNGEPADRPVVWSRRNGPWRRVRILWVGAAPGNAGGLGAGALGAHATRIPFGGDIAGGNLDVLLASIGLHRNDTFIVAALNQLPARGGGEPTTAELAAPVGDFPNSVALLRATVIASGAALVIALGNVALRTLAAAVTGTDGLRESGRPLRLPTTSRLTDAGFRRGEAMAWPVHALPYAAEFVDAWRHAWGGPPAFHTLPVLHPSAQNMSPFAGTSTVFHQRMRDTRDALRRGVQHVFGEAPPDARPAPPGDGIYDLPEWRELIQPATRRFDDLWRQKGI